MISTLTATRRFPRFRMGQYGLTIGGPIKKNKTFFFLSYEGLRQFQSITQQFTVPSGLCCGDLGSGPLASGFQQQVLNTSPQMCTIMQAYPVACLSRHHQRLQTAVCLS